MPGLESFLKNMGQNDSGPIDASRGQCSVFAKDHLAKMGQGNDEHSGVNGFKEIFDCKDFKKFMDTVTVILSWGGFSRSMFFLCQIGELDYLVKMSLYFKTVHEISDDDKSGKINESNTYDVEIKILELLRQRIIYGNISPCILELLDYQICTGVKKLLPPSSYCDKVFTNQIGVNSRSDHLKLIFCFYRDYIDQDMAYDKMSFLALEECSITLHKFLDLYIPTSPIHIEIFKSLLFQVIYTIYAIKQIWPKFYHGDLHTDNVMLMFDVKHKYSPSDPKYLKFWVDNEPYYLPYFGIIAKIIDFGLSGVPEEGLEPIMMLRDKDIITIRLPESDILFLLSDINRIINSPDVREILDILDPNGYYVTFNPIFIRRHRDKLLTEADMLKSSLFKKYARAKVGKGQILHEYNNPGEAK